MFIWSSYVPALRFSYTIALYENGYSARLVIGRVLDLVYRVATSESTSHRSRVLSYYWEEWERVVPFSYARQNPRGEMPQLDKT